MNQVYLLTSPKSKKKQFPLVLFFQILAVFCTVEFITQYSAVSLSTLVTSQLFKKGRFKKGEKNNSTGSGLFSSLFLFHTAQYQKDSCLDAIMLLIFKLVHFMHYKQRKSLKNRNSTKNVQNTGVKFSLNKRSHYFHPALIATLYKAIYMLPLSNYSC